MGSPEDAERQVAGPSDLATGPGDGLGIGQLAPSKGVDPSDTNFVGQGLDSKAGGGWGIGVEVRHGLGRREGAGRAV